MWNIYLMEYYIAKKMNKVLTHPTTRKNLEKVMLSERYQTQKDIPYDSFYAKDSEQAYP